MFASRFAPLRLTWLFLVAAVPAAAQSIPNSRADLDGDCVVTRTDVSIAQASINKRCGQPGFNQLADVNGDCVVNTIDTTFIARLVGRTVCEAGPLPTIAAVVSPPPNVAGWNNSSVTISFACTNATSCPAPVTLATDGANQIVERSVSNSTGQTATARVTLNIDRTAPLLTLSAPISAAPGQNLPLTVSVADLSGVPSVDLFDGGVSLGTDAAAPFAFAYVVPAGATRGTGRVLFARAQDRAGNWGSTEVSVRVDVPDTTLPLVRIEVPAAGSPDELVPVIVSASDDQGLAKLTLTRGGTELRTALIDPFSFQVNEALPHAAGSTVTYQARAEDTSGNVGVAEAIVQVTQGGATMSPLRVVVDPPVSPTFQTATVLTGTIGDGPPLPAPRRAFLASVSPAEARQGATLDVSISGANTQFVANETLLTFGPGITVDQVNVVSPTEATARITVARDAGVGPRIVVATASRVEAALINAFTVRVGTTRLTGRAIGASGNAIAGAQACVPGTSLCTVTGADGTFAFDEAPLDATRVVLTASGYVKSSVPVKLDTDGTDELGDLQLADADVPPPPPPPNGPVVTAGIAKSLGLGASEFPKPGPQNFDALVKMIRDTIVAVGGSEIGVFDEDGHQLNPAITGAGYASYRHHAVEALAWRQAAGEVTTLGETLVTILLSFQYSNPSLVPRLGTVLEALQNEVNAAWTSPARPGAPLMFVLFNQGRAPLASPPVLSLDTPLNELQKQLLISSFLTFRYREFTEPGAVASLGVDDIERPWLGPSVAPSRNSGDFALLEGPAAFGLGGPRFVRWSTPSQGGGGGAPSREVSQPWINVYAEVAGPEFRNTLYGSMGKLCGEVTKTDVLTPLPPKDSKFGMRDVILQAVPKCPEVVKLASNVFYTQFGDILDREKAFYNLFKREGVTLSMKSAATVALQGNRPNKYEIFPDGSSRQLQTGLSAETKRLLGKIQDAKLENEALTTLRRQTFSQLATKDYKDSVLYQDWQKAKNEAKKMNLANNGIKVVRSLAEGFFGMAEGVAFGAIMDLEVDLILQSLRPRPPLLLEARQVRNPETDVPEPAVAVIFQRSDNDHLAGHDDNVVWSYELWRQTGSSIYRVALERGSSDETATREMVMYDTEAPPGTHLYRVVARRRVGGPIEYAPTDFDTVVAPMLGALVPGFSGTSTPAGTFTPGAGIDNKGVIKFSSGISFGALKTALDPLAKTLKGLAYQVSDPSDPLGVNVVTKTVQPPVGKLAIDPFGRRSYLSLPSFGRIFQASPSFTTYVDTGFAPSPGLGFHSGLGIDRFGHLYVDNVASDARFGGRVFRYKYPNGERELVGSVNYYSQLLQFANAVSVADMVVGPDRDIGEALYIADSMSQRITKMTLPESLPPGVPTSRNISQSYATSPLFDFPPSSSLVVRHDGTIFFNQYDNIVKVPPQYSGGASYTPSYLFRPGTSLFVSTTGMAADAYGNLYVTDSNRGTITMLPWIHLMSQFTGDVIPPVERKLLTIARGLANPQGVAVLPFSRGLAYFDAERAYASIAFGFSAIIRDAGGNPLPNATVLVPDRNAAAISDGDGVVVMPDLLLEGASSTFNYIIRHDGKAQSGTLALTPGVHNVLELTFEPTSEAGPVVPLRLITAPLPGPPSGRSSITPNGRNMVTSADATVPGIRPTTGAPVPGPLEATCPAASIIEPATRSLADDDNLTVRGTVSPRTLDHVLVEVNGAEARATVNADGSFALPITLTSGKATISVTLEPSAMASFGCNIGNASGDDRVVISPSVETLSPSRNPADDTIASLGYRNTIRGQILDKETGQPIVGLPVSIVGGPDHGTTDRFGVFQLNTTITDYADAIRYANSTVAQTVGELDLLASALRAGEEGTAMDQIEVVLNSINRITYDQSPVAAANARKLLATLDAVGKIMTRVVQAIEEGADVDPADVDAIQQAANDLVPWQSVDTIEITSTEAPDLSILIKVQP